VPNALEIIRIRYADVLDIGVSAFVIRSQHGRSDMASAWRRWRNIVEDLSDYLPILGDQFDHCQGCSLARG
jgi:hypothetical protein